MCKRFAIDKFCKFGEECAYRHPQDKSEEVHKLTARNKLEIDKLKEEVKELKSEIKCLTALTRQFVQQPEDITREKNLKKEESIPNILVKSKFKCDKCECSFKKEVTLQKHKNTKHAEPTEIETKILGKAKLGHVPAEKPDKEINADTLTTKGEVNETEVQVNKPLNTEHPNEYVEAMSHEDGILLTDNSGFEGIDDMFQIEILEGEPVFACNICNEGFDQDYEIRKHVEEDHNEIVIQITTALEENEEREFDDDTMTTLSDNDNNENEDSEDDEAFLARFDSDGNCIG